MADWESHLSTPPDVPSDRAAADWFGSIAKRLLQQTRFMVVQTPHRIVEVEFYFFNHRHPDPFSHQQPIQRSPGKWYFHRTGSGLRGGSFKGLDLTFGPEDSFGGVLIRTLETPQGQIINGPSLCVDHLLESVQADSVAALEEAANRHPAASNANPIRLTTRETDSSSIFQTSRGGLSLKRVFEPGPARYFVRPYRFLTHPQRVKKGKVYLVLALHLEGKTAEQIQTETGCPRAVIARYVKQFETGRREKDVSRLLGKALSTDEICQIHGALCEPAVNRVE